MLPRRVIKGTKRIIKGVNVATGLNILVAEFSVTRLSQLRAIIRIFIRVIFSN